jgi:hypothetical protein
MKAVSLLIGVCIVIALFGAILGSITAFRSAEYIQPANVSTSGNTSTTVKLVQPLLDDNTGFITITSSDPNDAAVPYSYLSASQNLTISGLEATASHYLYITFRYNQLGDYLGADTVAKLWPLMIGVGILGIIGVSIYTAYDRRQD